MRVRVAAGVAVLVAATLGIPAASARGAPSCLLLTDPAGDVTPVADDNLDVRSADIASNGDRIAVTIRTAGTPLLYDDPAAPFGRYYRVTLRGSGGKLPVFFEIVATPLTAGAEYGHARDDAGNGTYVYYHDGIAAWEPGAHSVTVSVPLSAFAGRGKFGAGARIGDLTIEAGRIAGYYFGPENRSYHPIAGDTAKTSKTYVAGSPSCLHMM